MIKQFTVLVKPTYLDGQLNGYIAISGLQQSWAKTRIQAISDILKAIEQKLTQN